MNRRQMLLKQVIEAEEDVLKTLQRADEEKRELTVEECRVIGTIMATCDELMGRKVRPQL